MTKSIKAKCTVKKYEKAFFLIDLIVVMLIISILLAIAVPNFVRARAASHKQVRLSSPKNNTSMREDALLWGSFLALSMVCAYRLRRQQTPHPNSNVLGRNYW
jgi:Tfp pilus assembly major pilin PilA